jgi:hypothetical protein
MIRAAGVSRAAMMAESPIPPAPKMTTSLPGCGAATWKTAPAPVCTPQPKGARAGSGTSPGALTAARSLTTVWVAKDDCPKKVTVHATAAG